MFSNNTVPLEGHDKIVIVVLLVEPAQHGWKKVITGMWSPINNYSYAEKQQLIEAPEDTPDNWYHLPYTSRQATMTVSHTYFSFSSWVEVGNIMPTIVISAMYKDSMKCVVSRGGLRLFQKLIKTKLLWKLISI